MSEAVLSPWERAHRLARRAVSVAVSWVGEDRDLLLLWLGLSALQPWIAPGSPFARADLGPWCALTLGGAAALRGRALGQGPHPALPPRRTRLGGALRRLALAVIPLALLLWIEAGRGALVGLVLAPALTLAILALRWLTRWHARTAWAPQAGRGRVLWGLGALAMIGAALGVGVLAGARGGQAEPLGLASADFLVTAVSLGLEFLAVGLYAGRLQHLAQRRAAGAEQGAWRSPMFPFVLALCGPPAGLLLLLLALEPPMGGAPTLLADLGFSQAYIVSLYVIAWARVLWPRPVPVARTVLLHEVVPTGGRDTPADLPAARAFGEAPTGALRFNPNRIRRTRVMHPWVVPVLGPRVATQDDPVRSPWARPRPPAPLHALGEARFEPDPVTGRAQTEVITLTLSGEGAERGADLGLDALTRRVVVLRAFPRGGAAAMARRTFAWEPDVSAESVQVVAPGTRRVSLLAGDVILIASGARAMAYEVELGACVEDRFFIEPGRAAQLEDYARVVA